MTTYAPNFTPRTRVKYVAFGIEHTIQMRSVRGATVGNLQGKATNIRDCFNAVASLVAADFAFISVEGALTDSDVFFPLALPAAVIGAVAVASMPIQHRVTSTGFVGRSAGSRASIFMYGVHWPDGFGSERDNGRVTIGEVAQLATIIGILNANAVAGSGAAAIFAAYANIKVNDHLLKLVRRGTIS